MIIVVGYALTDIDKRDADVEAHVIIVERARMQDGCIEMSICADSVDPGRINIVECWRDKQSWDAWRRDAIWPKVVRLNCSVKVYCVKGPQDPYSVGPLSPI